MTRTVLVFGLIAGVASSVLMLVATPFVKARELGPADLIGYSSMVIAGLMIFFGVRSYRQNVGGGTMTFGRGFLVGLGITLVTCALYVATFQVLYHVLEPGIEETYAACMIERAESSGASPEELAARREQAEMLVKLLRNPWANVAVTLIEPLPVGLVLSILSAAILRRRPRPEEA